MLVYLLKSAIYAIEARYNTPERKGARGELKVHNALTFVLDAKHYNVLSDLILPLGSSTTQLDHLVVSRFGIFVIETKNMSGWIFGGSDQRRWTQVHKGGKRHSFQNPLRQNYAHVKAVQDILGVDDQVLHNFVVFTGTAQPKTAMPRNVAWGVQELGRLFALHRQPVLSATQVIEFTKKLNDAALENSRAARKQHIENIQIKASAATHRPARNAAGASAVNACPKCGAMMVRRTNSKTGDGFWGCSSFPKCRGTREAMS